MTNRELLPHGAEVVDEGVRYRVWAPRRSRVEVELLVRGSGRTETIPLILDASGYYHVIHHGGGVGDLYRFRLDGEGPFPDPASRWQPEGVHGRSMVIDPRGFQWKDAGWMRPRFRDLAIYELHIGTFTPAGTFQGAIEKLPHLRNLGLNAIQIMPVADFPGQRSWGYDGVSLYAPARCYGTPDDFRALVDAAHELHIAVVLDAVYNHLGPDGNYMGAFSPYYFTKKHHTPWGDALNFDDENAGPVRSFFVANAIYWLEEFHIDGLRLDATHEIKDDSLRHILEEITDAVHQRGCYIFAEDERNETKITMHKPAGYGFDAVYADDFCHTVQVALGDHSYAEDFEGTAEELADVLVNGWHYRGAKSRRSGTARGEECNHLPPEDFLFCISNHDQVGNRGFGERLSHLASPEAFRAASALLLLSPYTPQIFMGQEWGAATPFLYFTDHHNELGKLVSEGRRKEFARHPGFQNTDRTISIPDPQNISTFENSKLNWEEVQQPAHSGILALYQQCLQLRMSDPVFRPEGRENWKVENLGVVALRYRDDAEWLILVDFVGTHRCSLGEEQFSILRTGAKWKPVLSTNERRFGGNERKSFDSDSEVVIFHDPELLVLKSGR